MKLPKDLTLNIDREINLESEGADVLSDEMGFCVFSFEFLILAKDKTTKKVKFYDIEWDTSE